MKLTIKLLIVLLSCFQVAKAQNISPVKRINHAIDSLKFTHVDTIIYYHIYCSECDVKSNIKSCVFTEDGHTEMANILLYQQSGKYYSFYYDCDNLIVKTQLSNPKSVGYFLSIIPSLNKRDKFIKELHREKKFLPPIPTDGACYEAVIYCKNIKQEIFMHSDQQLNNYDVWRKFFWIDEQIKVLHLLRTELFPAY